MSEVIRVTCPEHEQEEIIEVQDGEIRWCSRVAGRPSCGGMCLSPGLRKSELEPASESKPAQD